MSHQVGLWQWVSHIVDTEVSQVMGRPLFIIHVFGGLSIINHPAIGVLGFNGKYEYEPEDFDLRGGTRKVGKQERNRRKNEGERAGKKT